jgi:general secretion pathway protein H
MMERHPSRVGDRAEAGFTLVELLVVLAVIGLLIVAAPTLISAARPGLEARAAAQSLANDLREARGKAIATNNETKVIFDSADRSYMVDPGGRKLQLPAGLALTFQGRSADRSPSPSELIFFADGSSTGGRIRIASAKREHWIVAHALTGGVAVDE